MVTLTLLTVFLVKALLADEQCSKVEDICKEKLNCQECIRAHHCCVWCYDENFKSCVAKNSSDYKQCNLAFLEHNLPTKTEIIKNVSFTDVEDDVNKAVQFKPAEFNIDLRYGEPVNISVQYQPARNYPLDLYYLMDLTLSMEPDLDILKELGSELTILLTNLTKNYRIAFGSYVDKPEMPFYATDPVNKENPCSIENRPCEQGYLFKHKLNFTEDIDMFINQVNASRLSANLDDLEGGMDALMQIISCGKKLGWDSISRKLVIIATGGGMHLAGDGILAGYVKRNHQCWIDSNGNYLPNGRYDYPSLEEIYHRMKNAKINLILAAKPTIYDYYKEMEELLKETIRVEKLISESKDVLNVVREGYYNFIKQVHLFMNTTHIDGLQVDFFSDCDGDGNWEKKPGCNNAMEGKEMDFTVQLTLKKYQDKSSEVVYIEENNIQDKIKINLNFVGTTCNCTHLTQQTNKICQKGELVCGDCVCFDGWVGETCSTECKNDYTECRFVEDGIISLTCSGRGDCICSKCTCNTPYYKGQYCEFQCPYNRYTNQICEGHGNCIKGICVCNEDYSGKSCECHESNEKCKIPGFTSENVCSGNGVCKCNKCNCKTGYSGQYCENCDDCRGLCSHYESTVVDYVLKKNSNAENKMIRIEKVDDLPESERSCVYRYDAEDGKKCDIFYKYDIRYDRSVDIQATEPSCNAPLTAGFLAIIIVGAFLALAALIIIVWKGRNWYRDKKEYEEFLLNSERARHSERNPIYRNPITEYRNPIQMDTFHSKNE